MPETTKKILEIIRKNFPNGVRADFIDTNKILRMYAAKFAGEKISNALIDETIRAHGLRSGEKFYFIPAAKIAEIQQLFAEILQKNSIAYYSAVYEKHSDFFAGAQIFSVETLKKILPEINDGNFYFEEFCATSKTARLDSEIEKILMSSEKSLTPENLREKFCYVPEQKILETVSDTKKFLPTLEGGYIPISSLQFDLKEISAAKNQLKKLTAKNDFVDFEKLKLSSNFALNPAVAKKNLREVIYEKFFAAEFKKRGNKLLNKNFNMGKGYFMPDLKKFVAARQEVSLEELSNFARNLGLQNSTPALIEANRQMIRVERDFFVRDSRVKFDVAGIDAVLELFVRGKIIPLRAVTSFTGFPAIKNYSWNLFLLESFVRRFSKKFSFMAPGKGANSSNAGAIYPKSMKFADYVEVQVAAIIQEKILLESSAVENFLISQGYKSSMMKGITEQIILKAGNFQKFQN